MLDPISPVTFTWRGVTFGVDPFQLSKNGVQGWLNRADVARENIQSPSGHGSADTPAVARPRQITLRGFVKGTRATRDELIQQLRDVMWLNAPWDASTEPLVGTMGGRTGRVQAQLDSFDPSTEAWAQGAQTPWVATFNCPNPRILGDSITVTAPLSAATVRTRLPQRMPFRMAANPIGGVVSVLNPGTDRSGSFVTVTLTGAQSGTVGVRSITTGALVTYDLSLGTADVLTVGSETGGALNGEYRKPQPYSSPAWRLRAQPGVNVYEALAKPGAGSPAISVTVEPAS